MYVSSDFGEVRFSHRKKNFCFFILLFMFFFMWMSVLISFFLFSFGFRCSCFCSFFFILSSCSFHVIFHFLDFGFHSLLHLHVHVVRYFHCIVNCFFAFIFSFVCSCCQPCLFFHLVFGFVFPVHCVLMSRYAVLCLFPVCVYSYIQIASFAKVPQHVSKTFWLRSKANIANKQDACHEATWKSQWTSKWKPILAMNKNVNFMKQM